MYNRTASQHTAELPHTAKLGPVLLVCAFLAFGAVASWYALPLANRFGPLIASALILISPFFAWIAVSGLRIAVRKWSEMRSNLVWWHWLWFFVLASGFVLRVRDATSAKSDPADAAALFRVAVMGLVALILATRLALRRPDWLRSMFSGNVGAMTAFAMACAVSTIWSVNPPWTFYKSLEFLIDLALLAAILAVVHSSEDYETLFNWNWILCGLLIASAWVGAVIWPKEALEDGYSLGTLGVRLNGLFPGQGSNRLGDLGAILGVVCFSRIFPFGKRHYDRFWYVLVLLACVATIVFAQTRTALAGLLLGMILVLVLTGRAGKMLLFGVTALGAVVLSGAGKMMLNYLQRGQSQAEMVSLSDRLNWWTVAFDMLRQHPWTGLGAFAAGTFAVFEKLGLNNVGPLHSDYVETLVGSSFWGFVPLVLAILGCWWVLGQSVRDPLLDEVDRQLSIEALAVLLIVTIRSIFMTFITLHPPLNFLIVLGYAEFLRRRRHSMHASLRTRVALLPDAEPVSAR